jgi:hypothetical protein
VESPHKRKILESLEKPFEKTTPIPIMLALSKLEGELHLKGVSL